jgi:hypothetical protein
MKKIVLLTMLINVGLAQKQISYTTPKRDTLFLENSDIGKTIKQTWEMNLFKEEPKKPVIVMVDNISAFAEKRKKVNHDKKK